MPTLLHLIDHEIPEWCEGELLPGCGGREDDERTDFVVEAKKNPALNPFKLASIAMRKGKYKRIYYTGYIAEDLYELYNLEDDLEELHDLYHAEPGIVGRMKEEILEKLQAVNQPYQK